MNVLLIASCIVCFGCRDELPVDDVPDLAVQDLAVQDLAPRTCGDSQCTSEQACVLTAVRPPCDASPCVQTTCWRVPTVCVNQRTCACLDHASPSGFCGPGLMCGEGGGNLSGIDLVCTST
jgi:hypothetical protein